MINLNQIRKLSDQRRFKEALSRVDDLLAGLPDCPYLWNYRGHLIQLLDEADSPPIREAEVSYLKALALNPDDLEALESLAHFYDTVGNNPADARKCARGFVERADRITLAMRRILEGK